MNRNSAEKFLKKYAAGDYTEAEHAEFLNWLDSASDADTEEILQQMAQHFEHQPADEHEPNTLLVSGIESQLDKADQRKNRRWYSSIINWAALLVVVSGVGLFAYTSFFKTPETKLIARQQKIVPGTNKGYLQLASGRRIVLNQAANGLLAVEGNIRIYKTGDGQLKYIQKGRSKQHGANVLMTPHGGQYQVTLVDGTHVWLNAASSIRIPLSFNPQERRIDLTGEGYFEVTKNKHKPFTVCVDRMEVKVLGTHFNVCAYADEPSINTTLLEGSVKVYKNGKCKMIVPGQQARVTDDIKVCSVNVQDVVEWKNGNFSFSHEDIQSIMRKLSRWYDVEVSYVGKPTHEGFVGMLPRSSEISEVLNMLELTKVVHFKIDGRRIIVMK
ncbi:FecR domain-containing protein [Mucilaginibacter sp. CSA2-8R]|uniref:FecR domain-containing protein n=1 Tax=Mucilaginibacter sp. CSA2-8R TaxID=3141542 RepID=UPI00315CD7F7